MVDELRSRFRDLSDEQAQAMFDKAVAAAKSKELEELRMNREIFRRSKNVIGITIASCGLKAKNYRD